MFFTKFSVLDKKDTLKIPVCLYHCTSIGSITSAFSLKIYGQKEQGGIIKLVAVVNMKMSRARVSIEGHGVLLQNSPRIKMFDFFSK